MCRDTACHICAGGIITGVYSADTFFSSIHMVPFQMRFGYDVSPSKHVFQDPNPTAHNINPETCKKVNANVKFAALPIANRDLRKPMAPPEWYARHIFKDVEEIGKGANGKVFAIKSKSATRRGLDILRARLDSKVVGQPMLEGESAVVKIIKYIPALPWREWVAVCIHEAQVHAYLNRPTSCVNMPCTTQKVCSAPYVPRFYMGGIDVEHGVFVLVMGIVAGVSPLASLIDQRKITAQMYVDVEKALITLWLLGVVHGDMHRENILVRASDSRPFIIDFGLAVVLPRSLRPLLRHSVTNALTSSSTSVANAAWYKRNMLGTYVNSVVFHKRKFKWYNPDGKLLRLLWNSVPVGEREKIPGVRKATWKWTCVPTPNKPPPTQTPKPSLKTKHVLGGTKLATTFHLNDILG